MSSNTPTFADLTEVLTELHAVQNVPHPAGRVVFYMNALSAVSPELLRIVALVLAEGNAFGPDAARSLAMAVTK